MRTLLISDVHSNLDALEAVFAHVDNAGGVGRVICLGDIVGYNAQPREVIALLRAREATCVAGNHDLAAIGAMDVDDFNPSAAEAALWSGEQLQAEEREYLAALPMTLVRNALSLAHGSLRDPVWEYLLDEEAAVAQFSLQSTPLSAVGHSHIPFHVVAEAGATTFRVMRDGDSVDVREGRFILNPGSVGQPRDGDPRASYAVYDDAVATVAWLRVPYDIESAQRKVREAGLDPWLANRLAQGR